MNATRTPHTLRKRLALRTRAMATLVAAIGLALPAAAQQVAQDPSARPASGRSIAAPAPDTKRVYVLELTGIFAEDITQTPIREAIRDARNYQPDILVVMLNNTWDESLRGGLSETALGDDLAQFDMLFRAEDIEPIFTREIPTEWEKQPQIVFWVRQAMGGAAFLPFTIPTIYMHSDARIGGLGIVEEMFEGVGDEVVREKQRSLRLGHARGMFIQGGHDTRVLRAMAETSYILSYSNRGGRPELFERMPMSPDEFLLTDDGGKPSPLGAAASGTEDTDPQIVRGEGDDTLTLRPKQALDIGISKGTVDTLEQLMFELGIERNHEIVRGRGQQIMDTWRQNIRKAPRQLERLFQEYNDPSDGGRRQLDARQTIGVQIAKLREMDDIIRRYEEAIQRQMGELGLPGRDWIASQKALHELQLIGLR